MFVSSLQFKKLLYIHESLLFKVCFLKINYLWFLFQDKEKCLPIDDIKGEGLALGASRCSKPKSVTQMRVCAEQL